MGNRVPQLLLLKKCAFSAVLEKHLSHFSTLCGVRNPHTLFMTWPMMASASVLWVTAVTPILWVTAVASILWVTAVTSILWVTAVTSIL